MLSPLFQLSCHHHEIRSNVLSVRRLEGSVVGSMTRKYCMQMLRNWIPYNWPYRICRSMYTMIYYYVPLSNESASAGSKCVKFDVEPENGHVPISDWNYACIHTLIYIDIYTYILRERDLWKRAIKSYQFHKLSPSWTSYQFRWSCMSTGPQQPFQHLRSLEAGASLATRVLCPDESSWIFMNLHS